ncbi:hypothetical protein [uncultured Lactobacillus sp.]|uniref:hypothetical protein n=1 Tax=uncultured Lactobacillus sp. TaxID=153152 RepID=UPI00260F923E|nr:hypothetical protein [uncultured Lactobacillus sp.]
MFNLTVNPNLSSAGEFENTILVIFLNIMLLYFLISGIVVTVSNKKIGPRMLQAGVVIVFSGMLLDFIAMNKKEDIALDNYNVLESSLLLDKVNNATIDVELTSAHKFIVEQNEIKNLTSTVHGKKVVTTTVTTTGKAYLKVVDYIKDKRKKEPTVNIKITPGISNTVASYETPKGKFRVICYADNQSKHKDKKSTTVLKY